jgi:Fur family transcriptional regulator, ferric uptake regulator
MIASTQTNHPLAAFTPSAAKPSTLDAACERLREAGLRITQPRIAILNALIQRHAPATIEQLHGDLNQSSCDLVTVYRCLSAFQKAGMVRLSFFHNGTSLYELSLGRETARFHVVDKATQSSEPIDASLAEELNSVLRRIEAELKTQGYQQIHTAVNFFGAKAAAEFTERLADREASPAIPEL